MATILDMRTCLHIQVIVTAALLGIAVIPARAEDLKVSQLEQDVRDLQRTVQQQSRRIETIERELAQARPGVPVPNAMIGHARVLNPESSPAWLNIANWDRVHTGTMELDVIAALGPPNAVRKSEDGLRQTLLYSAEITAGGFLSGQVVLADHRVVDVQKPTLK